MNELKVEDVLSDLSFVGALFSDDVEITNAINLIKQQAEQLEAARKLIIDLKDKSRQRWYQVDGYDESAHESIGEAVQEAINLGNEEIGEILQINSWDTIDNPSFYIEILSHSGDNEGDYKIVDAPKPEEV